VTDSNEISDQLGLIEKVRAGIRDGLLNGTIKDGSRVRLADLTELKGKSIDSILDALHMYSGSPAPAGLADLYQLVRDDELEGVIVYTPPR